MARTSKKLKAAYEAVDRNKAYALAEAVALVKSHASSKFDETIEIAMNLGVDPRHADQMVRGVVASKLSIGCSFVNSFSILSSLLYSSSASTRATSDKSGAGSPPTCFGGGTSGT